MVLNLKNSLMENGTKFILYLNQNIFILIIYIKCLFNIIELILTDFDLQLERKIHINLLKKNNKNNYV